MNISDDLVNESCVMNQITRNNKFRKKTWTFHKKGNSEIAKCHDESSKITSIYTSNHEGYLRLYFIGKEPVKIIQLNYLLSNDILGATVYLPLHVDYCTWMQYSFDDEFKFEFYE
jgi:hypothetical protein